MSRTFFKLGYILSFLIFPLLAMELASQRLANIPLRLAIFGLLSLGGAWIFKRARPDHSWITALFLTTLGYGFTYKLATFIPDVSAYPFSLSWSEASRYYYASLWFSKSIYGVDVPPSILHPSRYLVQSLPFFIPGTSLLVHRLWQVVLWMLTASLTSWLLVRRLVVDRKKSRVISLCVLFWSFLFLFQGPIYYHLLFMVIVLLWGFDSTRFWRNMLLVIFTSLWAGISRINWLPVPGLIAASLYLLEVNLKGKPVWRYILPPLLWVFVGTGFAYASMQIYESISGNPAAWFGSSFSSDLLWYRLLPNPTFPMGILPSAIFVSLPLVGLIVLRLFKHWHEYHLVRLAGLASVLFILFSGGIVVSVKIGGGSNLHNLDAYLTLLLVIGSYIYFDRFIPDSPVTNQGNLGEGISPDSNKLFQFTEAILVALACIIPLYFTLITGGAFPHRDYPAAQAALQSINSVVQPVTKKGEQVLFINQRHLLTFDYFQGVPLVPEDELVFLMEMAMSNNVPYLQAFYDDLAKQRFGVIVSEPLNIQYQGRSHSFGEENDAWVKRISEPILCFYEPEREVSPAGVVLYTPRADPCR
jgi:hypothetical protein